jgi:hypothetical protein
MAPFQWPLLVVYITTICLLAIFPYVILKGNLESGPLLLAISMITLNSKVSNISHN